MSAIDTLTWKEFCKEALEFLNISQQLEDTWSWEVNNAKIDPQNGYLKYKKKLTDTTNEDLIEIEYHIVYSVSYQVPVLYFQAFTSEGKSVALESVWHMFENRQDTKYSRANMLTIITQMDHPIFFRPFMCLHPCRTSEILAATPKSNNRVLTFISVMGPFVHLSLDNRYGLYCQNKATDELKP